MKCLCTLHSVDPCGFCKIFCQFIMLKFCYCTTNFFFLLQKAGSLPDNKIISSELSKKSELQKYMKRVMPFAQTVREKIDAFGLQALNLTLDFDEMDVLSKSHVYLLNTLDVSIDKWLSLTECFSFSISIHRSYFIQWSVTHLGSWKNKHLASYDLRVWELRFPKCYDHIFIAYDAV